MDSDFVSEYRSLADPGDVTSSKKVEEAQLFKKILKTNTAQFKSDTDKALRRSVQAKKERERLKALRGGKGHTFLYSLTSAHSHRLEAVIAKLKSSMLEALNLESLKQLLRRNLCLHTTEPVLWCYGSAMRSNVQLFFGSKPQTSRPW
ncbi:unnamed protein product [Durusdinium trenchii]|uniref:Uncharacterized protein n=1 Tax=Durusdinium trenchii TaxID=1381693 RepID=A0ABP0M083_9DINO